MSEIVFKDVTKVYKGGTKAVKGLDLEIREGEFIVLVGPSGCGKTTALRMVAGLEEITSGMIEIDGKAINEVDPGDRDIAMVFQNYALYPHMTVYDNISFPLQCKNVPKAEIKERVNKVAALLGLSEYLQRKPRTLSGGQRQRVAMGRALVREPIAFLMDEPLSNLDAKLRVQMRSEISAIQKELGITTIYVTHDQVEAMTMGTRIAVMRDGLLQQYGSPQEVYSSPANIFVAAFIGSPSMNFMKARVQKEGGGYRLMLQEEALGIPEKVIACRPALADKAGSEIVLGVRPEHINIGERDEAAFRAHVQRVELLGAEKLLYVNAAAESVDVEDVLAPAASGRPKAQEGDAGKINIHANLVVRVDSELSVMAGDTVDLSIRQGAMHFFALEGGQSLVG